MQCNTQPYQLHLKLFRTGTPSKELITAQTFFCVTRAGSGIVLAGVCLFVAIRLCLQTVYSCLKYTLGSHYVMIIPSNN